MECCGIAFSRSKFRIGCSMCRLDCCIGIRLGLWNSALGKRLCFILSRLGFYEGALHRIEIARQSRGRSKLGQLKRR